MVNPKIARIEPRQMNKLVCGADVCKNSIVCCFLSEIPDDIGKYFSKYGKNFPKFQSTIKSAEQFLSYKPTHLVLEPTGTNYAWIFAELATQKGIKVLWTPNHKCKSFRAAYDLPSKNDAADALALCLVGLSYPDSSKVFLNFSHNDGLSELRSLVLQHDSINRMKSPVVNRLRQQLAREFPEAALVKTKKATDGAIPLWSYLAGLEQNTERKSDYYDRKWDKSLAKQLGLEVSEFSQNLARLLNDFEAEQQRMEAEMLQQLRQPCFRVYNQVLLRFNLNLKLRAWIVAMTFPLERFMDDDGMKKARSRFKQRLGMGKVEHSSGDSEAFKAGGSSMSRKLLYMHVLQTVVGKNRLSYTKETDLVCGYYDYLLDKWNNDPKAIAFREGKKAISRAKDALDHELKGIFDAATRRKLKAAVTASIEADLVLGSANDISASRWKKLIVTRTAAKMCEYIWTALLDELYPKLDKSAK